VYVVLKYFVWAAAFFFAGSWTFGLVHRPDFRLKSTICTLVFWWAEIGLALAGAYSHFHLLWLMPLSIFVPTWAMLTDLANFARGPRTSISSILIKSAFILSPAVGLLAYFSR